MVCAAGFHIGSYLLWQKDVYHGTRVIISINSFNQDLWIEIAQDIINNIARGNSAVDWHLDDTGLLMMWLHTPGLCPTLEANEIMISCVLSKEIMSIHRVGSSESLFKIGVTNDGMWLSDSKRFCDDECTYTHAHNEPLLKKQMKDGFPLQQYKTIQFDNEWFNSKSSKNDLLQMSETPYYHDMADPLYKLFKEFDEQVYSRLFNPTKRSSQPDLTKMMMALSIYTDIKKELEPLLIKLNTDYFAYKSKN